MGGGKREIKNSGIHSITISPNRRGGGEEKLFLGRAGLVRRGGWETRAEMYEEEIWLRRAVI